MQFSATEAATKSLNPDLTSEAVPVISFPHPELKLLAVIVATVFLQVTKIAFVATARQFGLGQQRTWRRSMGDKEFPRGRFCRLVANEASELMNGMVSLRPMPANAWLWSYSPVPMMKRELQHMPELVCG